MTQPKPSKWALEKASLYSLSDKNIKRLALDFDAIAREVRAENHFTAAIDERLKAAEKLKRELEKAEGQLDIILRECQGDDDASLANDYGGTGWEKEVPVATVRWHRNRWKKSNEVAEKLATEVAQYTERKGEAWRVGEGTEIMDALAAYHRERMGR